MGPSSLEFLFDHTSTALAVVAQVTGCSVKFRCDFSEEFVERLAFPADTARVIFAMKDSDADKFAGSLLEGLHQRATGPTPPALP
jgi:hypothetical protein